jgi:hypothetical protein
MHFIYAAAEFRRQKFVYLTAEFESVERNRLNESTLKIAQNGFLKVLNSIPEIVSLKS